MQELLLAKRELKLPPAAQELAGYEALILDDLGYVQQSREEMEVLFTLLAERYERGSVLLTSNLPFSQMGADLQGCDDDGGGDRPPGASQRDPGAEPAELPGGAGQEGQARSSGRRGRIGAATGAREAVGQKVASQGRVRVGFSEA